MDLQRGVHKPRMAEFSILQLPANCQHLSNTFHNTPLNRPQSSLKQQQYDNRYHGEGSFLRRHQFLGWSWNSQSFWNPTVHCMSPPSARLIHYNASPSRFFNTPLPLSSQQHTWLHTHNSTRGFTHTTAHVASHTQQHTWLHTHLKWNSYMFKNCFNKLQHPDIWRNVSARPRVSSPYTTERFKIKFHTHSADNKQCELP